MQLARALSIGAGGVVQLEHVTNESCTCACCLSPSCSSGGASSRRGMHRERAGLGGAGARLERGPSERKIFVVLVEDEREH